jgi:hypothetical protein
VFLTSAKIDTAGYDLELASCRTVRDSMFVSMVLPEGASRALIHRASGPFGFNSSMGFRACFPPSIGAYCSDSSIRWTEQGFYYSIEMKCETQEMMVKLANSAIRNKR